MPDSCDLDKLPLVIHTINDPVWPEDNLANVRDAVLRNHATTLRLLLQHVSMCNESKRECLRSLRTVARDKSNNVAQVIA
jgi:hypothetical protein